MLVLVLGLCKKLGKKRLEGKGFWSLFLYRFCIRDLCFCMIGYNVGSEALCLLFLSIIFNGDGHIFYGVYMSGKPIS